MNASKPLALTLVLLALPSLALAQGGDLEQLRAENAVLRLELRALRKRMEAIESKLDKHLVTRAARERAWPDSPKGAPTAKPPAGVKAALTSDGKNLLLADLRLGADAGGARPEDVVTRLVSALAKVPQGSKGETARREALTRFGAFAATAPHAFLVPAKTWNEVRPSRTKARPVAGELLQLLDVLGGQMGKSRVTGFKLVDTSEETPRTAKVPKKNLMAALLGVRAGGNYSGGSGEGAYGVLVAQILAGTPISNAGKVSDQDKVKPGDVIESISCGSHVYPTANTSDMNLALAEIGPGQEVNVGIKVRSVHANGYSTTYAAKEITITLAGRRQTPALKVDPKAKKAKGERPRVVRQAEVELTGPSGDFGLRVTLVRLNGRWLLVGARATSVRSSVRAALESLASLIKEMHPKKPELSAKVLAAWSKAGYSSHPAGSGEVNLSLWSVSFLSLGGRDFGLLATPRLPNFKSYVYGRVPGKSDPRKYPYKVREAK
jgi:hypothetical protein